MVIWTGIGYNTDGVEGYGNKPLWRGDRLPEAVGSVP